MGPRDALFHGLISAASGLQAAGPAGQFGELEGRGTSGVPQRARGPWDQRGPKADPKGRGGHGRILAFAMNEPFAPSSSISESFRMALN